MESKGKSTSGLELTIAVPGSSSASSGHGGSCNMRDIDINQPAPSAEEELIPVITIDDREELDVHQNQSRPKKLRLSLEQSRVLEESFRQNHTLNSRQKEALAANLKLRPRQVEVWFQNRRARTKLKQTQMECAYLKRCFGSLTEENRRLQREVEELRGLGAAPPSVVLSPQARRPAPAATASTVCPRCQRLATIASSSVSNMDLITAFQPQQPSGSC